MKAYLLEVVRRCQKDGHVTTLGGRRRYLPKINCSSMGPRGAAQRQAVNTICQGSGADLIKIAMVNIHRELLARGCSQGPSSTAGHVEAGAARVRLVHQIHDELILEVPHALLQHTEVTSTPRVHRVLVHALPLLSPQKSHREWATFEAMYEHRSITVGYLRAND